MKNRIILILVFVALAYIYAKAADKTVHRFGIPHDLPDTGQETGDYSGPAGADDKYIPAATQPSYTDNGDTITDNRTGLMWAKDGNGVGCYSGGMRNWGQALTWAEGLDFATYADWRLPNVRELMSIVDYGESSPAVNSTYFPNTVSSNYWTSTTYVPDTTYAWAVTFSIGYVGYSLKTTTYRVRAVRSGP